MAQLRAFFAARGVLEVETPALAAATVTDLHLASFHTTYHGEVERRLFLQTSPEFAMKRLLAAGSGPIYQIAKAFRDGEAGPRHNPEFTMLEWYRPGFDHHALMDEVDALLHQVLGTPPAERAPYGEAVARAAGFDPHHAGAAELLAVAARSGLAPPVGLADGDREGWRDFLVSHLVEPGWGHARPLFVYDYPADQAALARLRDVAPGLSVAERFEVYASGLELANGYHELTDAAEQEARLERDRRRREAAGLPLPPLDHRLLAALAAGLPACAGVSIGVDRLVMLAAGAAHLDEVVAFPVARA